MRLIATSCFLLFTSAAFVYSAETMTIKIDDGLGADSYVQDGNAQLKEKNNGSVAGLDLRSLSDRANNFSRKVYMRFDLEELASREASDAELLFEFQNVEHTTNGDTTEDLVFAVYALDDSAQDGLGESWAEDEINWNNAPGNARGGLSLSSKYTQRLGGFTIPSGTQGRYKVAWNDSDLIDFINDDSNELVTFIMIREQGNTNHRSLIASKESKKQFEKPRLVIKTDIPEPKAMVACFGVVAAAAAMMRRRR